MSKPIISVLRRPVTVFSFISSTFKSLQPLTAIRTFKPFREADRIVEPEDSDIPPYPYGARQTFKQADRGLYGGTSIQFGNKISKGRNQGKTRRRWYPNVRLETIRSEALGKDLTIRITASCMRTINKCGGLDQYLLGDKPARIKELGLFGWKLRWKVMNSKMMQRKFAGEREKLGLQAAITGPLLKPEEEFEQVWEDGDARAEMLREQKKAWEALKEKDERFRQHVKTRWEPKDGREYNLDRVRIVPDPDKVTSLAGL
jgi:large subunit ribosomal protein L28